MHEIARFTFWTTLILYVATLVLASYVGVYLSYVAIPLIVLSGLIMKITKPRQPSSPGVLSATTEVMKATESALDELNSWLTDVNSSLKQYNRKQDLVRQRTAAQREEIGKLRLQRVEPEVHLKYAETQEEKEKYIKALQVLDDSIKSVEKQIVEIEKQCELEVARSPE